MTVSRLECKAVAVGPPQGPVLATVDATLWGGRLTAIVGPNGAGKSTLMSMMCGEREPLSGAIWLDGKPLTHHHAAQLARRRAFLPQDCSVAFDFTAQEVVELGRYPHRQQPVAGEANIVASAMAQTQVTQLALRTVNSLSGGERARVHLARALAQIWLPVEDAAGRWLMLDEPTAALDLAHQHASMDLMRRWAREQAVGVVAVIHDLNLALRYADDVLLLGHAQSYMGPTAEVLNAAHIARVWGVECQAVKAADGVAQYLFGAAAATCTATDTVNEGAA